MVHARGYGLLVQFPGVAGYVAGGRDASWIQLWLMAAPLLVWLVAAAVLSVAVLTLRIRHLAALRRTRA